MNLFHNYTDVIHEGSTKGSISKYITLRVRISKYKFANMQSIALIYISLLLTEASLIAQLVKNLPAMQETWVQYLGWEDPLEKR